MTDLGRFFASPGMSSEGFTLLRAEGLSRVGQGGGVPGEDIVVHHVPVAEVAEFVRRKRAEGCAIDVKLLLLLAATMLQSEGAG
jgi:ADP-ribose pyrophosphatase